MRKVAEVVEVGGIIAAGRVAERYIRNHDGPRFAHWVRRATNAAVEVIIAEQLLKREEKKK